MRVASSMKIRAFVRSLVPPVLVKPLARLWPSRERPVLEYHSGGWNGLQNEVPGWNTDSVVKQEYTKWEAFRNNVNGSGPLGFSHESTDLAVTRNVDFHNIHISYAYVLALTARQLSTISVLDWGGGLGHYYVLGKAVIPGVEIKFDCRDVPLMCERGRQLCPEINFYEDDRCLENKYDLVMINGSLGYFENWKELLPRIIATVKSHLFLTRVLTVRESPSFVALQRTDVYNYHSDMLTQVFNEKELLDVVAKSGLRLAREFVVGDGPTIVGAPEQCRDCGWLFERKL